MAEPEEEDVAYDESQDDTDTEAMVGEYANFASVGSTQTEFYLDFFHVVPGNSAGAETVLPVRRIMISPMLVRGLVRALEEEISGYESTYHIALPTVES